MTFGINWDVANPGAWEAATPEQVYEWGFRGARYVARRDNDWRSHRVKEAGLLEMAVTTWESDGYVPETADWVQIHNERARRPGERGLMSADEYVYEWITYKSVFGGRPQHRWMFQGLHKGPEEDIPFLQEVLGKLPRHHYPDAIALHLYGHSPESARDYCDTVWNLFQIPLACTEWWRSANQGHHAFQCMLGGNGLDGLGARCGIWNSFFCLSDHMTAHTEHSRLGLIDLNQQMKEEFWSLLSSPDWCKG